jgi:1,4-alpha-glucan branching enzyme
MSLVEFTLFAPYNNQACLKGDFSDWESLPMEKGEDGVFRTQVELEDGDYQYKFAVQSQSHFFKPNTWVEVTDPYAIAVRDDETQNGIVRIRQGQQVVDSYQWQHDQVNLPADHELVIYEMHIGDFSGGEDDPNPRGHYKNVIEKLDYLCDLGINAIELMPVNENPGDYSWGYMIRHLFAAESNYGKSEDLKRLIDECHKRGIRVILDCVFNHTDTESPLTQIDHNYWYRRSPSDPVYNWGPEFDYEHFDENLQLFPARKFIDDVIRFWIKEYHVDGIRYDATKQIDNFDFLYGAVAAAKEAASPKPFYNIAEFIPNTPVITNEDGPMDGCWNDAFYYCITEFVLGKESNLERLKDAIEPRRIGYLGLTNTVNYIANHDQLRMMLKLADSEIFDEEAFRRAKLAAALLFTAVGVPMVWMGEEFGSYQPKETRPHKIDWTLLQNENNKGLFLYYKGLINLRTHNPALQNGNVDFLHTNAEAKVLGYNRWNDEGSRVVVVANLSDNYMAGYEVANFPENGTWHEWTRNYDIEVNDGTLVDDLAEYEARVYVWQ